MVEPKPVQPLPGGGVAIFMAAVVGSWAAAWYLSEKLFGGPMAIVTASVPFFFLLMLVEYVLGRGRFSSAGEYDISDSFSSIAAGAVQQLAIVICPLAAKPLFRYVHARFGAHALPEDAWYTLPVAFLVYDLQYYITHRFLHECNFGWAFHQVHHSSDHYNLSTALRQSAGQFLFGMWAPIMNAPFLPFKAHFIASACNTTYQFWVHSVVVHRLPSPIEYLFSTPAHHRVHHDRRVHKNYGGILIVWDRLFGSFLDEQGLLEGNFERELYGVLNAAPTWDPVHAQFDHLLRIIRRSLAAPKYFLLGPGYRPKLRSTALPPVSAISIRVRRKTHLSRMSAAYVVVHFAVVIAATFVLIAAKDSLSSRSLLAASLASTASLVSISRVLDASPSAWFWEAARSALSVATCVYALRDPSVVLPRLAESALSGLTGFYALTLVALVFVPRVLEARVYYQPSKRHKIE